jgi:hypothetical protein
MKKTQVTISVCELPKAGNGAGLMINLIKSKARGSYVKKAWIMQQLESIMHRGANEDEISWARAVRRASDDVFFYMD